MHTSDLIRHRLLTIEEAFFQALSEGINALENFCSIWSTLQGDVEEAIQQKHLEGETITLAHAVASRVAFLADSFMDFSSQCEAITNDFESDVRIILAKATSEDIHDKLASPETSPCPPYIDHAYKWLLNNIHDPYPSNEVKDSIVRSTGCSLTSINAWFTNARRRMGWTALCRKYFHNCRADTVDAAYRALVEEDPNFDLDPPIAHAFVEVKVKAEDLYLSKLEKSTLAGQLDIAVKDMTGEDRLRLEHQKLQEETEEKERKEVKKSSRHLEKTKQRQALTAACHASTYYPSPASSTHDPTLSTLEMSSAGENDADELEYAQPSSRKRHASFTDSNMSCQGHHIRKKFRLNSPLARTVEDNSDSNLLSPPSDVDTNRGVFDCWTSETEINTTAPGPASSSQSPTQSRPALRKRRMSDSVVERAPKCPGGSVGPRLYVVSDPLPKTNHDLAILAELEALLGGSGEDSELSDPPHVDVEIFDWGSLRHGTDIPTLTSPPEYDNQSNPQQFGLNSFTPDIFDVNAQTFQMDTYPSNFDIFSASDFLPPPYSHPTGDGMCLPSAMSDVVLAPSISLTSLPGTFLHSHLPSYLDASVDPISINSNGPLFEPAKLSTTSSELDLPMSQLPVLSPSEILRQNDGLARKADKQTKLEQLRALTEATRRLEAEIAADPVFPQAF